MISVYLLLSSKPPYVTADTETELITSEMELSTDANSPSMALVASRMSGTGNEGKTRIRITDNSD